MIEVVLRPGREKSLRRRHPWVLSGAVARVDGPEELGVWARVRAADGEILGFGHYSPHSNLRLRMLTFSKEEVTEDLIDERITRALRLRTESALLSGTDAVRLVNSEGDGLPGLIVDRYADTVVVKLTSAGMFVRRDHISAILERESGAAVGFERADSAAARREGMPANQGVLWGAAPAARVEIREGDRRYQVDVVEGQKTGFYLDQRDARALVQTLASGRRVLDLFGYTGGFGVAAAMGGAASVKLVESSATALALAQENLRLNAPDCEVDFVRADAFTTIRGLSETFDLIVIDPPPLARHKRDVSRASRAYKDVMLHCLRRAAPDALLLSFSCSHHVGADLFQKITFGAAIDARRLVQRLATLGAPTDHPISIDHPEGGYLDGLLLRA